MRKYGLTPKQYPDFAALRGDPSDNLPSVPGVGEKTATKWIVDYGSLEKLLEKSGELGGKVGESLRTNIEMVKLNRELTHLLDDVKIDSDIDDLAWAGFDAVLMNSFFEKLEIRALKERIKSLPQIGGEQISEISVVVKVLSSDELDSILSDRKNPIGVSLEIVEDKLIGYAIATSENEVFNVNSAEMEAGLQIQICLSMFMGANLL